MTTKSPKGAKRVWAPGLTSGAAAWLRFVCAMIIPCLIVVYLFYEQGRHDDLTAWFASLRQDWPEFVPFMKYLTNYGNYAFYLVYAGILAWGLWRKRPDLQRFAFVYVLAQLLICFALVRVLKIFLGCPRPDVEGLCLPLSLDPGHNALPSGHTAEIVGAVMPLVMVARPLWPTILAGILVGLMGYSRVFLGWHTPADVAFGLLFGGYAAWLIHTYGKKS